MVECGDADLSKDQRVSDLYIMVMKRFSQALMKVSLYLVHYGDEAVQSGSNERESILSTLW